MENDARLDALTSLQDWSKWLVGIDAGILGLLTFGAGKAANYSFGSKASLIGAIICFCVSLIIATWLVGAVPAFIMHLKAKDEPNRWWINWDSPNMYDFTYGGIRIQVYAFLQHLAFMFGVVLLTTSLVIHLLHYKR